MQTVSEYPYATPTFAVTSHGDEFDIDIGLLSKDYKQPVLRSSHEVMGQSVVNSFSK